MLSQDFGSLGRETLTQVPFQKQLFQAKQEQKDLRKIVIVMEKLLGTGLATKEALWIGKGSERDQLHSPCSNMRGTQS